MTFLCANQSFTVATVTANDVKTPKERLTSDKMNTVFQWVGNNTITLNKLDGKPFDTVALLGAEIPAGASIVVRAFTNIADSSHAWTVTQAMPAGAGGRLPIWLYSHDSAGDYKKITIQITTAATCRIARILVGKSILPVGIEPDAKFGFDDHSEVYNGSGFEAFNEYPKFPYWDVTIPMIDDASARSIWVPFVAQVGITRPFLIVPEHGWHHEYLQSDWVYGRWSSVPYLQSRSVVNAWALSGKVKGIIG